MNISNTLCDIMLFILFAAILFALLIVVFPAWHISSYHGKKNYYN